MATQANHDRKSSSSSSKFTINLITVFKFLIHTMIYDGDEFFLIIIALVLLSLRLWKRLSEHSWLQRLLQPASCQGFVCLIFGLRALGFGFKI